MSIARTGVVAAIPFVFGVLGSLLGGRITDVLARRGMRPIDSRKWPMAISLAWNGVFTALAAWSASHALAIGCISVAMFLCYVSTATGWALVSVAAPANCTASLGAMQKFRRLSRRRAGPGDDRADRRGEWQLHPGPAGRRGARAGLRSGLCDHHQGPDPGRAETRPAGGDGTGGIAVPAPATHALRFHRAVVGTPAVRAPPGAPDRSRSRCRPRRRRPNWRS